MKSVMVVSFSVPHWSRPARGAWVEILLVLAFPLKLLSRPARGAWVEIFPMGERFAALTVAPPKGRVG